MQDIYNDENVDIEQTEQEGTTREYDEQGEEKTEFSRDDMTVARRLREISAKKNEWKQRAEEYKRRCEELEAKLNEDKPSTAVPDEMERVFREDIVAIRQAFPHVKARDVRELPNLRTFALLRDAGLDAVEAYRASSARELIERAASEREKGYDDKAHLVTIGGQTAVKAPDRIPDDTLAIWRSAFPKLSDRELTLLYNKNK